MHSKTIKQNNGSDTHRIPVRISNNNNRWSKVSKHNTKHQDSFITTIPRTPFTPPIANSIRFGTWNSQSINKKAGSLCDLIISKHLDILSITETWLASDQQANNNNTIAEILLNTLKDFDFHHIARQNRTGGGVGVFLRKGFKVTKNESIPLTSMEYLDLSISHGTSTSRLFTIYRPPPSKKNRTTPESFFKDFSTLLETIALIPDYTLLSGDFNFHMDKDNGTNANAFKDILDSAGLTQHVTMPTHRAGHTLDLIIDNHHNKLTKLSVFDDHLPFDRMHLGILLSYVMQSVKSVAVNVLKLPFNWT